MAMNVSEIMNREIFSLRPAEKIEDALDDLVFLGISGAPVIDDTGALLGMLSWREAVVRAGGHSVRERMTSPAATVSQDAHIREAARILDHTGYHRLVVVNDRSHPVGVVSVLDVMRGLTGAPAAHPAAFPHFDGATQLSWSDDTLLDLDHLSAAPAGPGVLVLVTGAAHIPDRIVWCEETPELRRRVREILTQPQGQPGIRYWLDRGTLRFRCAVCPDSDRRALALDVLRARAATPIGSVVS